MPDAALVPTRATMLEWIETVYARGVRRPGYPANRWAEAFVRERFEAFGLERVRLEPVETPYWEPRAARLVAGEGAGAETIPCFAVPFSEPTEARGRLTGFRAGDAPVPGRIALVDLPFLALPATFPLARRRAERVDDERVAPLEAAGWCYDPDRSLASGTQVPPFSVSLMQTMEPAIEAGAAGFVGVLRGYPGGGCRYYVPYDGAFRPIPGVYVGEADGDRLAARLAAAGAEGLPVRLEVEAHRGQVRTHNVVGELPGADDEWVVIGSHHDGPWSSAVEDASGIALVLAQAAYWSRVARAARPHRLVFTVNAAHMAGGRGTEAFCERHAAELGRIVLELHLEHAARECEARGGALETLETPVTRWWFTSENAELERAVWDALVGEGLGRSLLLTPTSLGSRPTTDGGHFHLCGVPIVNYLTAPWYLFDEADTLDKVHEASLEPVTRAAIRLVAWTAGRSADAVRRGVRRARDGALDFDEAARIGAREGRFPDLAGES